MLSGSCSLGLSWTTHNFSPFISKWILSRFKKNDFGHFWQNFSSSKVNKIQLKMNGEKLWVVHFQISTSRHSKGKKNDPNRSLWGGVIHKLIFQKSIHSKGLSFQVCTVFFMHPDQISQIFDVKSMKTCVRRLKSVQSISVGFFDLPCLVTEL